MLNSVGFISPPTQKEDLAVCFQLTEYRTHDYVINFGLQNFTTMFFLGLFGLKDFHGNFEGTQSIEKELNGSV